MLIKTFHRSILFIVGGLLASGSAQAIPVQIEQTDGLIRESIASDDASFQSPASFPVLGYGVDKFSVGEELFRTDFSDSSQWVIQVQQSDEPLKERIKFGDGLLDLYMPARGCTAWLKQKFVGPIMIFYQVKCPLETIKFPEIQARDFNNFWHCSGVEQQADVLNPKLFSGDFGSYSKMQGWYASTGGGGRKGNRTTRFRRYPREIDGKPCAHISLKDRDGQKEFLITPGKWHTIQLVAFGDLAQYIVDGRVVYQIRKGEDVTIEVPPEKAGGEKTVQRRPYSTDEFPPFTEGYFGFRMVRSHHQYKNLSVHRLKKIVDTSE